MTGKDLTPVLWSAPALERAWRAEHRQRFPWFTADGEAMTWLTDRLTDGQARVLGATIREIASR
ncbi:hypothetical protein AB0K18_45395 [Nonomuraea sp. NPDC049421]|uniref:hypothetical protein n=1 Tax=Nonomuraea sp. NPDC049421 TaxID=3155275 RepID=UPI003446F315